MLRRFVGQQAKALGSKSLNSRSSFPLRSQSASPPFRAISLAASRSFTSPSRRHYSDQPQAKAESETSTNESDTKGETGPLESLRKEVEAKDKEIIDLKDKYLRSVADFRNLQERTKREISSARDFALQRFAKDLVDSVDNLDRALETVAKDKLGKEDTNKDLQNLHDGLKMTEGILLQTLKKHGLERFDPSIEGEKFNPNIHDASFMTKMEDKEDGTVFSTIQKGFMLNGRVIRAAKVGVVKNT